MFPRDQSKALDLPDKLIQSDTASWSHPKNIADEKRMVAELEGVLSQLLMFPSSLRLQQIMADFWVMERNIQKVSSASFGAEKF